MRIYKYVLSRVSEQRLLLPPSAKVLCVQAQHNEPCAWVLLEPDLEKRERLIRCYGTGHELPSQPGRYLGTVLVDNDTLVLHYLDADNQPGAA